MPMNIENESEKVLMEAQNLVTKRFTELGIEYDETPDEIFVDVALGKSFIVELSYKESNWI